MNNVIKYWVLLGMMAASASMAAVKPKAPEKTVISAENFMFNPLKNIAVYQGDVVVIDAQMDLLCDKLTIHFADKDKAPKKSVVPPPNKSGAGVKSTEGDKPAVAPMVGLGGNIDRILAEGDVEIINKKDKTRAVGGHALYTAATEILVLTINPKLYTKQGVLIGKVIEYNRVTGSLSAKQAVLENDGKPKPPAKAPSDK